MYKYKNDLIYNLIFNFKKKYKIMIEILQCNEVNSNDCCQLNFINCIIYNTNVTCIINVIIGNR